ncbi:hypothetical protein SDC9_97686 [bioreactor metagenome]|uniref:Uncharacterized protein n=1 Tax=bioreactor metagenome TaxID=1076179 RepID=A0A645ACQ5_9ZZZZ
MIISQVALSFLPNIELVSFLVMLYVSVYGMRSLWAIYVFVAVEGVLYPFGLWWISYLYIWTLLAVASYIFRSAQSPLVWAIISGTFGLLFGALCAIPYIFIGGFAMAFSYWVNGIAFDLPHCIGNFIIALVLMNPAKKLIMKLDNKS